MAQKYDYCGIETRIEKCQYQANGTLALMLVTKDKDSDVITVNLSHPGQSNTHAFLDTNHHPGIEAFIQGNGLGRKISEVRSRFCVYPLYEININNL